MIDLLRAQESTEDGVDEESGSGEDGSSGNEGDSGSGSGGTGVDNSGTDAAAAGGGTGVDNSGTDTAAAGGDSMTPSDTDESDVDVADEGKGDSSAFVVTSTIKTAVACLLSTLLW